MTDTATTHIGLIEIIEIMKIGKGVSELQNPSPGADPGGVQGVWTPALLIRVLFLKRTYFQNMSLAEQGASRRRSKQEL